MLALPNKAAPHVYGCKNIGMVADVLQDHVWDALTELSETYVAAILDQSVPKSGGAGLGLPAHELATTG